MDDSFEWSDQALVRRALDDPPAFQALYDRYFSRVYGYVAARITHQPDAEDIVSDIFLRVIQNLSRLRGHYPDTFAAWLFSIARNAVTDYYRQTQRQDKITALHDVDERFSEDIPDVLSRAEDEQAATLRSLIAELPERKREVIMLKYYGGLRNQEIAEVLRIGEKTVAGYLSRALDELHRHFTRIPPEPAQNEVGHDA